MFIFLYPRINKIYYQYKTSKHYTTVNTKIILSKLLNKYITVKSKPLTTHKYTPWLNNELILLKQNFRKQNKLYNRSPYITTLNSLRC